MIVLFHKFNGLVYAGASQLLEDGAGNYLAGDAAYPSGFFGYAEVDADPAILEGRSWRYTENGLEPAVSEEDMREALGILGVHE